MGSLRGNSEKTPETGKVLQVDTTDTFSLIILFIYFFDSFSVVLHDNTCVSRVCR